VRTAAIQQESSQAEGDTPARGCCRVIAVLGAAIASLLVAGSAYGHVVATTIADARSQARVFQQWGSATGPRGGRYIARSDGGARLVGVRVVRDATVSGVLSPTPAGIAGTVRLAGSGVPAGRLRVQLADSGRGRATGTLNARRVELAFRAI
jgi:hypothetical protein